MKETKDSNYKNPPLGDGGILHLVFNGSEISLMKEVIKMDESLAGNVIQIKDDFAVGPLMGIENEDGWNATSLPEPEPSQSHYREDPPLLPRGTNRR